MATTFEAVMDTTSEFFSLLAEIVREDVESADPDAVEDVTTYCRQLAERAVELGSDFDRQLEEFRRAAFAVVGVNT